MNKKQPTREKLLDITFDEVYIHGYTATSVDTILKRAGIPKGSMYHHFKGKKELVLAMVEERLFPKMELFFDFEPKEGKGVTETIRSTFASVAKNKPLITYGCPLYRLMVELSATDKEFDTLLSAKATQMQKGLASLLEQGKSRGEFNEQLNSDIFASFMLNATWGILSLSPTLCSSKSFLKQTQYILDGLKSYEM